MWFAIALLAGAFIAVALLAPKPKIENARASGLADFAFPRADAGDPVGIVKGTVRLRSPNTIWTGAFKAEAITKKVKTGLFSSKRQTVGYKYFIGMNLALCLGPNVKIKRIWFGKYVVYTGDLAGGTININLPELYGGQDKNGGVAGTVAFYHGDFDQLQDSYLVSKIGANVPAYVGVAHLVFRDFYFGNSPNIEAINVEAQCFTDTLGIPDGKNVMPNGLDENPLETLHDVLTGEWGRLHVNPDYIDGDNFIEAALTLWDEGNGMSLELARPNKGSDIAKEVLRQIDAILYQDPGTGKIRIKLIRNDYNIEDLPVLNPSSVREIKNYTKKLWDDTYNQVRVKFRNRANEYKDDAALDQDFANINMQQRVRSTDVSMPGVYVAELAADIAARERGQLSVPLFQMELEANRTVQALRPGDPFVLAWPEYNVARMVFRVRKFDLGELANGKVTIMCVQDQFATGASVFAAPQPSEWEPPVVTPEEIAAYALIEAPLWFLRQVDNTETGVDAYAFAFPARPSNGSLGFDVFASLDGFASNVQPVTNAQYDGSALLVGNYLVDAVGGDITIEDFDGSVDLSDATLTEIREGGANLFLMNGELFAFETVTDNGDGTFTLGTIRRGLLDTAPVAHNVGDRLYFVAGIDGLGETPFGLTDTVDFRITDRTAQGGFPVADATDIPITFDSRALRPLRPAYLTADGERSGGIARSAATALAWRERNRLDATIRFEDDATVAAEAGTDYEVKWRIGAFSSWTTLAVSGTGTTIDTSGATIGQILYVEVRSRRDALLSRTAAAISVELTS